MKMYPKRKVKSTSTSPFPNGQIFSARNINPFAVTQTPQYKKCFIKRKQNERRKMENDFFSTKLIQDLRIKQSIEQSIRSHIDRLADYRYNMMTKSDIGLPCLVNGQVVNFKDFSNPLPFKQKKIPYKQNKCSYFNPSTAVLKSRKKKQKNTIKNRLSRIEESETREHKNDHPMDTKLKNINNSMKYFEKLRNQFLHGLEKIHSEVTNIEIPKTQNQANGLKIKNEETRMQKTKKENKDKRDNYKPFSKSGANEEDFEMNKKSTFLNSKMTSKDHSNAEDSLINSLQKIMSGQKGDKLAKNLLEMVLNSNESRPTSTGSSNYSRQYLKTSDKLFNNQRPNTPKINISAAIRKPLATSNLKNLYHK